VHTRRTTLCIVVALAWSCAGSVTGVDRGPGSVTSIDVTPSSVTLAVGAEAPLQATVRDASGLALTGVPLVWSVRDTAIARISPTGVVTARSVGNTQIAASAGGVSAIATLTVQPPPVASVVVQPLSSTLVLGESATFGATPRDVNGAPLSGRVITWSSNNTAVATVSQAGEVATHGVGAATITATSEGASGSATVTVSPVPVASVAVQPSSATITVGGTITLGADIRDASGAPLDRGVTWSSDNSAVASVSAAGVVTALTPGSATITAQSEGRSGTAAISVIRSPVASIAVAPGSVSLVVGGSVSLVPTLTDASGTVLTDRIVTWTSSDLRVAMVSTAGVVTGVGPGSATITAASEGKTGTSAVTVVPTAIASVTLQPDTATIRVGASTALTPTVKDVTGAVVSDRDIAWTSSNVAVATVSATGVVTGRAVGTATVSATSGGKSGSAFVTVVAVPVGSVTVSPASVTLVPTQETSLSAVVRDANGVIVTDRAVTWSSSNTAVAIVSPSGSVTAVAPGVATVTATSEGRSGSASISVVPVPVGSVAVSPASSTVTTGQTTALSATVRDTNGTVVTDRAVTWSSSDETIATVSSAGVVTGMAPGTATITASSEGKSGSAAVTVLPVPVATVTLEPASVRLEPGQTATLAATTKSADGAVLTGRLVTFASDNVNVARVSSDGVVTGVAPGTATITATSEGRSATAAVTVQPTVAYVIVAPSTVFLRRNSTVQLSVTAYDAAGREIVGRTVTWSTDNDHAATVSQTGLVRGEHAGTATISATIDGKTGSTRVTVTN
jgi:trimeric autotransporter adhesin